MTKLQSYRSIYILNDLLYRHIDRAAVAAVAHSQSEGPDKGVFLSGMPQYATHYQVWCGYTWQLSIVHCPLSNCLTVHCPFDLYYPTVIGVVCDTCYISPCCSKLRDMCSCSHNLFPTEKSTNMTSEIKVGAVFESKEALQAKLLQLATSTTKDFRVSMNRSTKYLAVCYSNKTA